MALNREIKLVHLETWYPAVLNVPKQKKSNLVHLETRYHARSKCFKTEKKTGSFRNEMPDSF